MVKHNPQTNTISIEMSDDKRNIKHILVAIPAHILDSAYFPIKAKHSFSNNTSEIIIGYKDKCERDSSDNVCAPEQHLVPVSQSNFVHSTTGGDFKIYKSSYDSTPTPPTSPTSLQLPVIDSLTK